MSDNSQVPSFGEQAFICPYCKVYSQQEWVKVVKRLFSFPTGLQPDRVDFNKGKLPTLIKLKSSLDPAGEACKAILGLTLSFCASCGEGALWKADELIYPVSGMLPPPAADMPKNVLKNYEEASKVAAYSTNAAAALLRLALQNLLLDICKSEGISKVNHHTPLGKLIGLIEEHTETGNFFKKAMDIIRKAGNKALHPLDISSENPAEIIPDNEENLFFLAKCLNLVTEQLNLLKKLDSFKG